MKALLYKDFCVLKKVLRLYLLFFVLYGLMAVFNEDSGFLSGVLLVMAGMLPLTALASDEQGNFGRFGQVLPVSLRAMVGEKYLLGLISMAAGGGVSLLLLMIIELLHGDGFTGEMLAFQLLTVGVLVLACGVLLAVMLPLGFWLGVEKARLAVVGGAVVLILLVGFVVEQGSRYFQLESGFVQQHFALVALCAVAAVAALLAISFAAACRLYGKREFS